VEDAGAAVGWVRDTLDEPTALERLNATRDVGWLDPGGAGEVLRHQPRSVAQSHDYHRLSSVEVESAEPTLDQVAEAMAEPDQPYPERMLSDRLRAARVTARCSVLATLAG
jgi:hypothetical protein